jgi:hypothetical protein
MRGMQFTYAAIALLGMLAAPNRTVAQQMANDRFDIALSHPVTVGAMTLQPGNYSVEPLTITGGDSPVLLIDGPRGIHLRTAAMTTAAFENRIEPETRVLLHHIGGRYYFDKIWVKGMAYGYNFALPKGVKGRGTEVQ